MKIDEHRQQLDRRPSLGACGFESCEQLVEMLEKFCTERRRIEPPPATRDRIGYGCSCLHTIGQTVRQNEPADHADAKALEQAKMVVNLGVPARSAPATAPGRRAKPEVPSVVEPWIVHADLHACASSSRLGAAGRTVAAGSVAGWCARIARGD